MAVGPTLTKAIIDQFIQSQAQSLLGIWQQAQRMHQEALQIPDAATLQSSYGYSSTDVNNLMAIVYQLDRLQNLLNGVVPGDAAHILGDAALVLTLGQ